MLYVSGYRSMRNVVTGSFFGRELINGLKNFAHNEDLGDILKIVSLVLLFA
jgi:hypothetical protein